MVTPWQVLPSRAGRAMWTMEVGTMIRTTGTVATAGHKKKKKHKHKHGHKH